MSFLDAVNACFRKYFRLRGRARRAEYWYFYLFFALVSIASSFVDVLFFDAVEDDGPIALATSLLLLIPYITVTVRRLHDTGRPGYYILTPLVFGAAAFGLVLLSNNYGNALSILGFVIMAVGVILPFVWLIQSSQPGENRYGPNPIDFPREENLSEVFQ
ncbi:MAG: DUF805 domain-containing protein [Pseudomonadota bacterium]